MNKKKRFRQSHAFTLIEIMIVVLIIGALAALVAPNIMKQLVKSQIKNTKTQTTLLCNCIKTYYMDVGEYPKQLEDLVRNPGGAAKWDGPYVENGKLPVDSWGEAYEYTYDQSTKQIRVSSHGPDKSAGTEDDIKSWE